ncbi:MAG TPA: DNA-binding response regulator [Flavobacteriales bacterium]|nr:DNA-binding response regulator [Flavobacteriales bacterium]
MRKDKTRVLLVDDQNVVRDGVITMLSFQPDMEVVGEAQNGVEALEIARRAKPDVILLDMQMPVLSGLSTIPKIKAFLPDTRILVLTSFSENDLVYQAIKAGALGYLLKDATRTQLVQAIRDVAEGKASIHPSVAMKVIQEIDDAEDGNKMIETLTQREFETLKLIARGFSNQEIALTLYVHERTIAKYVSNILKKLHVSNRTQAALYAVRNGLATAILS